MQRAVALTAALVIAVSGFMLGGGLGASVAEERYALNTPQTTSTDIQRIDRVPGFRRDLTCPRV